MDSVEIEFKTLPLPPWMVNMAVAREENKRVLLSLEVALTQPGTYFKAIPADIMTLVEHYVFCNLNCSLSVVPKEYSMTLQHEHKHRCFNTRHYRKPIEGYPRSFSEWLEQGRKERDRI